MSRSSSLQYVWYSVRSELHGPFQGIRKVELFNNLNDRISPGYYISPLCTIQDVNIIYIYKFYNTQKQRVVWLYTRDMEIQNNLMCNKIPSPGYQEPLHLVLRSTLKLDQVLKDKTNTLMFGLLYCTQVPLLACAPVNPGSINCMITTV